MPNKELKEYLLKEKYKKEVEKLMGTSVIRKEVVFDDETTTCILVGYEGKNKKIDSVALQLCYDKGKGVDVEYKTIMFNRKQLMQLFTAIGTILDV